MADGDSLILHTTGGSLHEPELCGVCEENHSQWVCVQCNSGFFCPGCWDQQYAHSKPQRPTRQQRGRPGKSRQPPKTLCHEKVDLEVYYRLRDILDHSPEESERRILHEWEEGAKWFGIDRGDGSDFGFEDYPRFKNLMADSFSPECPEQFPSFVSFIGTTGAGKSTVASMLLALQQSRTGSSKDPKSLYPVPGFPGDPDPTTGDVQLYADPKTSGTRVPILFADCEGLDGGGKTPKMLQQSRESNDAHKGFRRKIPLTSYGDNTKREDIVLDLFPKLLYTVSTVVVFVLKEPRTLESVVSKILIPWARRSIYTSVNQSLQPHLVIALNQVNNAIDTEEWSPENSTRKYLGALTQAKLEDYIELWKMANEIQNLDDAGHLNITTITDLLEHLYASVTVVQIPEKLYYNRMDTQIEVLYQTIAAKCVESYEKRRADRMALNVDGMEVLLSAAFSHFSENPKAPFDMITPTREQNPILGTLAGNILEFALTLRRTSNDPNLRYDTKSLFDTLIPVISSCLLFDAERYSPLGDIRTITQDRYRAPLYQAFDAFCKLWLPCTYQRKGVRCCNYKSAHEGQKGHQGPDGKPFGFGPFETDFRDPDKFFLEWLERIVLGLRDIETELSRHEQGRQTNLTRTGIAARIHSDRIGTFLSSEVQVAADFVSHRVCFFCLRHRMPDTPLPCGHVLCAACVDVFSNSITSENCKNLDYCPFQPGLQQPFQMYAKPPNAGVRVLCLDGGGIRGIVQLAILREIEREFEGHMRIQWFFDLVVGTSTGGIVALGLFVKNKPLRECMRDFTGLCSAAFTSRELSNIPILREAAILRHGSKYKTRPFETLLQKTMGREDLLFDGRGFRGGYHARVAVVSTETAVKHGPVVLTDYNRPQEETTMASYEFIREERPEKEMKIWEAARATSAAVPYFKTFVKQQTGRDYCDGGLYHNCPVNIASNERRLLWGDVRDKQPDILLSLGTGRNPTDNGVIDPSGVEDRATSSDKQHHVKKVWRIAADMLQKIKECQSAWDEFVKESTDSVREDQEFTGRYIRLNVDVPRGVPALDETRRVLELEKLVAQRRVPQAQEVAHRLLASCFYFRSLPAPLNRPVGQVCGEIRCRFLSGSDEAKGLGQFIAACARTHFRPSFLVQRSYSPSVSEKEGLEQGLSTVVSLSDATIFGLRDQGFFSLPIDISYSPSSTVRIGIRLQERAYTIRGNRWLSISGFPRCLDAEFSLG